MSSIPQTAKAADDVSRDENEATHHIRVTNANFVAQNAEADEATRKEHDLSVRAAVKLYTKAIMFSLIFSLAVLMEGYDISLIGTFFGFTPFLERYGDQSNPESPGSRIVSARWQTIITVSAQVGSIIGLCINGWVTEKIGLKKTMLSSLILMIASTFVPFFAQNLRDLLIGAIFQGLPWGVFQALAPTYASDVMPVVLRPYSTAYINLCWLFGQLTAAGVLRGFLARSDQWAYRIPFAIQWAWPVPIFVGTILAPESPWWLCRRGRDADARKALRKLTSQGCGVSFDVDAQVAMMQATNQLEMETSEDQGYLACFHGTNLRRTEISSMAWVAQASCGAGLMGFSVQLYKQAGLSEHNTFNFNIAQYSIGVISSVGSWLLMKYVGRRKIYLYGFSIMFVLLLAVGICGVTPRSDASAYGAGSLLLVYTFFYNFTVGSVGYTLISEIPSTRLKNSTISLARCAYNVSNIIVSVLLPLMLSPKAWNWGAKTGFFWAGACALLFVWSYFRLPEPKDRINWELDVLFEQRISARKFASTNVDQFSTQEAEPAMMTPTNSAGSGKKTHTKHEEGQVVNPEK